MAEGLSSGCPCGPLTSAGLVREHTGALTMAYRGPLMLAWVSGEGWKVLLSGPSCVPDTISTPVPLQSHSIHSWSKDSWERQQCLRLHPYPFSPALSCSAEAKPASSSASAARGPGVFHCWTGLCAKVVGSHGWVLFQKQWQQHSKGLPPARGQMRKLSRLYGFSPIQLSGFFPATFSFPSSTKCQQWPLKSHLQVSLLSWLSS